MAKCGRCKQESATNKSGFCDKCHTHAKEETRRAKEQLSDLIQWVERGDMDKSEALSTAKGLLDDLRKDGIPMAPSVQELYDSLAKNTFAGNSVQNGAPAMNGAKQSASPPTTSSTRQFNLILYIACVVFGLGMIVFGILYINAKNRADNFAASLMATQLQVIVLEDEVAQLKLGDAAGKKSYTFTSGNYTAGVDFVPGTYDLEAISGSGNVYTSDHTLNAIMGNEAGVQVGNVNTSDFYEKTYDNIYIADGVVLSIDGVKIRMKRDN